MNIFIAILGFLWFIVILVATTGAAKPSGSCNGGPFCREVDYTPLLQGSVAVLMIVSICLALAIFFAGRGNR